MDDEMDLMLQKKSQVIDTGKQEYRMPEKTFSPREEMVRERKLGQMTGTTSQNLTVSFGAVGASMLVETGDMDTVRKKGRIFMHRFESRNRSGQAAYR